MTSSRNDHDEDFHSDSEVEEAFRGDLPLLDFAKPWSNLDLQPYRKKCLADEPRGVLRAVVAHHAPLTLEKLQLIHTHAGENVFCVRCAASALQQQRDSRLVRSVGLKFGLSAQGHAGSVAIDCGDITVELTIIDRSRAFVRTTRVNPDGPRLYVCRFLARNFHEVGAVDVPANGITPLQLAPSVSAKDIGFIEIIEFDHED